MNRIRNQASWVSDPVHPVNPVQFLFAKSFHVPIAFHFFKHWPSRAVLRTLTRSRANHWLDLTSERGMAGTPLPLLHKRSFGETSRRDNWWLQPLVVFLGLSAFIVYATWAAFQGDHYTYGPLPVAVLFAGPLRRFAARLVRRPRRGGRRGCRTRRRFLILWAPAGLPAHLLLLPRRVLQGVLGRPAQLRRGRTAQGLHRREQLAAPHPEHPPLFPVRRGAVHRDARLDAIRAFWFADGFGIGIGTLILCANAILLGGYTFGCHSLRHIIGGRNDCLTESPTCHALYKGCSAE